MDVITDSAVRSSSCGAESQCAPTGVFLASASGSSTNGQEAHSDVVQHLLADLPSTSGREVKGVSGNTVLIRQRWLADWLHDMKRSLEPLKLQQVADDVAEGAAAGAGHVAPPHADDGPMISVSVEQLRQLLGKLPAHVADRARRMITGTQV